MNSSEGNLGQTVRQGVARMRERLQAEQKLAEVAREYPEMAATEMLVFGGGNGTACGGSSWRPSVAPSAVSAPDSGAA